MDPDSKAAATLTRSTALFDRAGGLVTWDEGFEIEFARVKDLISVGVRYSTLVETVKDRASRLHALDSRLAEYEVIEWPHGGGGPFGTPRAFLYRNSDRKIIRVDETVSSNEDVFRIAADVTAEWSAKQELEDAKRKLAITGQPATVPYSFVVTADGEMELPQPSLALKRLYGLPDDFEAPAGAALSAQIDMTHEERVALTEEARRCMSALEPLIFECPVRDADGNLRWIHNNLVPRKLSDGKVVFEGGMRDITSEKVAQDQIDLLRAVVVQSSDSVIILETNSAGKSTILYVNPAFERLFGRSLAELAGKEAREYSMDPADLAIDRKLKARLEEGDSAPFTFQAPHHAGPPVWVEARIGKLLTQADGAYRWAVISRDISDSKRAADELARSEHMLAEAQRMAKTGTWELDLPSGDVRWTDGMYRLIGYEPTVGRPGVELFRSALHPDDREMAIAWGERILSGDENISSNGHRVICPDGEERFLHSDVELVKDDAGKVRRVIGTVQNVTHQHASELELLNALELAKAADRAKSEFLANMSHELRTPLNAIIGFSELLMLRGFSGGRSEKQDEYLQDIYNSGKHLLDIINDILSLSKIEAGQTVLDEDFFELPEVADWIFRLLAEKAKLADVTLESSIEPDLLHLQGDSRLFRQALLNLVSNAIKFSRAGSCVRILAERQAGHDLLILISDSGIGMTAQEIAVALTPFGQVESALQRKFDGTGLGLPLAKKFIELHGGELRIESTPLQGTNVAVVMPRARCTYLSDLPTTGDVDRAAS